MSSGWLVAPVYDGTTRKYEVYRLVETTGENVAENREVQGSYLTRNEALKVAKGLNKQEAERFWTN